MTNFPLVSIIIPVYNMEMYIEETLISVIGIDYPTIEIIIVDDGSTDKTAEICLRYSSEFKNIRYYYQQNAGPAKARNYGISGAKGEFIFPVDGDNKIAPDFLKKAIDVLLSDNDVKVVAPSGEFFGERTGTWNLPAFSLQLLARKNMMDTCAVFRKSDWEKTGGYCEEIIAREDWEFWISMLKRGGQVVKLPLPGIYYRIRSGSKRQTDRQLKKHVVDTLNKRHKAFFHRMLGGKLRYARSWSRSINFVLSLVKNQKVEISPAFSEFDEFVYSIPEIFAESGTVLHKGRNEISCIRYMNTDFVIKSFKKPNLLNQLIYSFIRKSKARRSFEYAKRLLTNDIKTPEPVAFIEERRFLLFNRSFYISLLVPECVQFRELINNRDYPQRNEIITVVATFTASLHHKNVYHNDYSAGNILIRKSDAGFHIYVTDLNRIRFKKIDINAGCKNFERLDLEEKALELMAHIYAEKMNYNETECVSLLKKYRWRKLKN